MGPEAHGALRGVWPGSDEDWLDLGAAVTSLSGGFNPTPLTAEVHAGMS